MLTLRLGRSNIKEEGGDKLEYQGKKRTSRNKPERACRKGWNIAELFMRH